MDDIKKKANDYKVNKMVLNRFLRENEINP
jgi:hypothetical protein